jgi:transposase-like protein
MASLDLYFKGCSLRDIQDHLNQFYKIKITHVAILKWVRKYMRLMRSYVEKLTPKTSGIWHTDEMTVNVNGELKWLWNLMDNDTRFLLASQIHKQRGVKDVKEVFAEAKEKTKSMPIAVVHDGLRSYDEAFNKEFFTLANPRVQNVRSIGQRNGFNQLVERIHGTIRERDKVMRALDNEESAKEFIEAFKIWYNFLRPHMSLGGLTPAERAGIQLGLGENRWEDLIKQAYISRKLTSNHEKP